MLRISIIQSSSKAVVLRVEGEVKGPWVEALRRSCEQVWSQGAQLTLDVAGLSFIDLDAIAFFRMLMDRRVILRNLSPFVAEQLGNSQ